jgi:diguanylate cyclase (GGDEF)-like protein
VPVSIAGSTVGVLHVVQPADQRFSSRDITGLTSVAKNTGSRVGMISAMAQSQLQANTDPLTGLLNRRSMENEVRTLLQHGESLAVVIADLDHFKVLNDTFGHDAGDRALRLFARVLRRSVRETDLVCRYGGEEFIIVCPSADKHTARFLFDRVRLELEAALSDGRNPSFTVSAGVADSGDAADFTDMISLADVALMQAKSEGRNRTIEVAAVG